MEIYIVFIVILCIIRLALINSGGIRAAIDAGNVTLEDLLTTFPFSNTFDVVTLPGSAIRDMLEHSVSQGKLQRSIDQ